MNAAILVSIAFAACQVTVQDRAEGLAKAAKQIDIEAAQQTVDECEDLLKQSIKMKDGASAKAMRARLKSAKEDLLAAKKKNHKEYMELATEVATWQLARGGEAAGDKRRGNTPGERALLAVKYVGPISIKEAGITTNSIGLPVLTIVVRNNTDRAISAFDLEVECWNSFDEPVRDLLGSNTFISPCQTKIESGETMRLRDQLSLHAGTAKATVRVTRAKAEAGQLWEQSREDAAQTEGAIVRVRKLD